MMRFETDNIAGDGALWEHHFPDFCSGVTPYQGPDSKLPHGRISAGTLTYITSKIQAEEVSLAIIGVLINKKSIRLWVGL